MIIKENLSTLNLKKLSAEVKQWGLEIGFDQVGITDTHLQAAELVHQNWIAEDLHGEMDYMAKHGTKRSRPAELVPDTIRVITVRLDYLPPNALNSQTVMCDSSKAFISRYALGRDYHKVMRNKLQKLCNKLKMEVTGFNYRVFSDSAPVMEIPLAEKAGLGWQGKHTLLINKNHGSWFFLGEIYTNLPLIIDTVHTKNYCGTCKKCIDICPTQAITAPYELDARRCISYLTIELKGSIPLEFRTLIGNRVYGCDDCQLICPWNKFAETTNEKDFFIKNGLDNINLIECFSWSEQMFDAKMSGTSIYRIGYKQWLRNIAIGLGNAESTDDILTALHSRINDESTILREHVAWAIDNHKLKYNLRNSIR